MQISEFPFHDFPSTSMEISDNRTTNFSNHSDKELDLLRHTIDDKVVLLIWS